MFVGTAETAEQRSGVCGFAGTAAKRQRNQRKTSEFVAFSHCGEAKRQRKKGNPAKSAAFTAGKKPKRQRNQRKTSESVAFPR